MSFNIEETLTILIGCTTCRSKKVRCDRQRPICFRCQRLQLNCFWPSSNSPKERRRGHGTIRAREGTGWSPPQILPLTSKFPDSSIQVSSTVCPGHNEYLSVDHSGPVIRNHQQRVMINSIEHTTIQDLGQSSLLYVSDFADQRSTGISNSLHATSILSLDILRSTTPLYRTLTNFETALPSSLVLTKSEHGVLADYQKGFLLVRATKSSAWCFHTILLRQGSRSSMVMQLLLAAALQEMSNLRPDDSSLARGAQADFLLGAQILAKSANCEGFEAHLNFMTSLYMMYMYIAGQQRCDQRRTKELSKAVRDHVKKYKLLDFNWSVNFSSSTSKMSENYCSLMAYMIMNLQDEDLLCGFQDCGGDLTNYLVSDENMHDIYLTSKLVLQNYWGVDYPQNEIIDDTENNVIPEMRFSLNMLMHKINNLSLMSDTVAICSKGADIENEMTEFERVRDLASNGLFCVELKLTLIVLYQSIPIHCCSRRLQFSIYPWC